MNDDQVRVILKRFEKPDEVRVFEKGRFEPVRLARLTIGQRMSTALSHNRL
jgi:hypothetical protein